MYRHNSRHGSVRHGAPALLLVAALAIGRITAPGVAQDAALNTPPAGFTALFNGRDLAGWKGLVADPPKRAQMSAQELAAAQEQADARMREHWRVADGVLVFDGKGDSLCTARDYGDFELRVDWKIEAGGDSGIYLRGSPQVQIWEKPAVGSGGLYNNQKHPSQPLFVADRPPGEWNTFRILMSGERVTVYLNGVLVVDDTPLENYWERGKPICPTGQIELQNHGGPLWFRDIFIRELPASRAAQPAAATLPGGAVESVAAGLLQHGDRVAIVGDSITEQKWYSRFMEDYLVACLPELELRVAQFGWSGERAPGFAARMANDLLPWRPTVVTTCYGMNDGLYRPYELGIGTTYADGMRQIVAPLLERKGGEAGAAARPVRVVVGAPGAVDTFSFRRPDRVAPEAYNDNLAHLRDIARELAREFGQPFANVHDHMVLAMLRAKPALGQEYHVCGGDGFHPAPNGHLVMAYAFLKALGCDGQIGTITLEWGKPATA
ncbi:MAG: family 16 glycoside hydrolase, partial [Planctomycetota bacterium]